MIRIHASIGILLAVATLSCASALAQVSVPPARTSPVEVFTNSGILLTNIGEAKVFYMDGLQQLQDALSQGLPGDPERAAEIARQRAKAMGSALQTRAMNSAEGMTRAAYYGVNKVPAIVFDGRVVVYGVTDIAQARLLYAKSSATRSQGRSQ